MVDGHQKIQPWSFDITSRLECQKKAIKIKSTNSRLLKGSNTKLRADHEKQAEYAPKFCSNLLFHPKINPVISAKIFKTLYIRVPVLHIML